MPGPGQVSRILGQRGHTLLRKGDLPAGRQEKQEVSQGQ